MFLENTVVMGIAAECLGCLPPSLSGAVHVERQQNGDEELFRPPLLVNDLAAVAKLVMEWAPSRRVGVASKGQLGN
jgi:hypothetical protein